MADVTLRGGTSTDPGVRRNTQPLAAGSLDGQEIEILSKNSADPQTGARSSGGERYIDTVEVRGSKPRAPTIDSF